MRVRGSPPAANADSSAGALVVVHGDQQTARRLRVVRQRHEILRDAAVRDVRAGEVAVAGVAARPLARGRDSAGAGQERQRLRLQDDRDAAAVCQLPRVAEQPEPGHVGDGVRPDGANEPGSIGVQAAHRRNRALERAPPRPGRAWRRARSAPCRAAWSGRARRPRARPPSSTPRPGARCRRRRARTWARRRAACARRRGRRPRCARSPQQMRARPPRPPLAAPPGRRPRTTRRAGARPSRTRR